MQQKNNEVLCEWIVFGKKFYCDPKKSHLVGRAEKITFPPFNYDLIKSNFGRFWCFWPAVYNTAVTLKLPRWCSWLHWSLLTPLIRVVWHGSLYGILEGRYKNNCCNYGKIHSYAVANQFYSPKNFFSSLLNAPNSFIWLEGHFRSIYLEEITNIGQVDIFESILVYFDDPMMVNIG